GYSPRTERGYAGAALRGSHPDRATCRTNRRTPPAPGSRPPAGARPRPNRPGAGAIPGGPTACPDRRRRPCSLGPLDHGQGLVEPTFRDPVDLDPITLHPPEPRVLALGESTDLAAQFLVEVVAALYFAAEELRYV